LKVRFAVRAEPSIALIKQKQTGFFSGVVYSTECNEV